MPQNNHIEEHIKLHGKQLNHTEKTRKKESRLKHVLSKKSQKLHGIKAKLYNEKRRKEKIQQKKTINAHEEKDTTHTSEIREGAVPTYLLDRSENNNAKVLSNMIKQKRKEKAGKWAVHLPKVQQVADNEMFRVIKTGKRKNKAWKRMVTKPTFVSPAFTRLPPKYERFIRPMGLRYKVANVVHPELKASFKLEIIGVKKNPSSPLYTGLGVLSKGTIIEVNVSELGLVTQSGKVVWGKYAQITNCPENDGVVNAVLLV